MATSTIPKDVSYPARYVTPDGLAPNMYTLFVCRCSVTFTNGLATYDMTNTFSSLGASSGTAACIATFSDNRAAVITGSSFAATTKTLSIWAKNVSDGTGYTNTNAITVNVFMLVRM